MRPIHAIVDWARRKPGLAGVMTGGASGFFIGLAGGPAAPFTAPVGLLVGALTGGELAGHVRDDIKPTDDKKKDDA